MHINYKVWLALHFGRINYLILLIIHLSVILIIFRLADIKRILYDINNNKQW